MDKKLAKAYKNMKSGIITKNGFLGNDKRKLTDIISSDEKAIKSLKLNLDKIFKRIEYFKNECEKKLGETIIIDNKWEIKIYEARGFLPCPFEDGIFRKKNIQIKNISKNKIIFFSDLSLHLFKKHHFLQGSNSEYRINPEEIKEILEL